MDKLHEECGVFGIYDVDGLDPATITYYALYALQHRGQESCGIAVNDQGNILYHKDMGLVPEVFNEVILRHLKGNIGVGHVRYSTAGASQRENAQPLVSKYVKGTLTVAHNGNLANVDALRQTLEENGAIFQTTSDSEIISYMIAKERIKTHSVEEALLHIMDQLVGAYSVVIMTPRKLIGARDPYGIRPLSIGKIKNSYVLASETCALDAVDATFVRDVNPGEVVIIEGDQIRSLQYGGKTQDKMCIFEYIYVARPDSYVHGISVDEARKEAGRFLATEHPVDADIVIGVPDSGLCAAQGYAEKSGIPYGDGFIKNRYIGRTFILPEQHLREDAVRIKLNVLKNNIVGKRVIMVDDSIVRGTTCMRIVHMLKEAGAKEVHVRISSPPFLWPCYLGTDIPTKNHLAAYNYNHDELVKFLGADSLGYMTSDGLKQMVGGKIEFCDGCFSGTYPMEIEMKEE